MAWTSSFRSSVQKAAMLYDHPCSMCEEDNKNVEANHFCKQCSKLYCDPCVKMHATFFKGHAVLSRSEIKHWGVVQKSISMETCEIHRNKEIEMYCDDHDEVCCCICISTGHRACKVVSHIPDVAKGIRQNAAFKALPGNVTKATKNLNVLINAQQQMQKNLQEECKSILSSITAIRRRLNKLLDQLQKRTMEEMDKLLATIDDTLQRNIDACMQKSDGLKTLMDGILDKSRDSEPYAFAGFKICEKKLTEAERMVQSFANKTHKSKIKFNINNDIEQYVGSLQMLGKFETSGDTVNTRPKQAGHVYKMQSKREVVVKVASDNNKCRISGTCQLSNGDIVSVDNINSKVKMLNENFTMVTELELPQHPVDICYIGGNEVVVIICNSSYDKYELKFLNTSGGKLLCSKTLTMNHECIGTHYHNGQIYVSSYTAIYMYTTTGQLVKKLYEDTSDRHTVCRFVVSDNGSRIYITNYRKSTVRTMDNQGNVLATLSGPDLEGPIGLCVCDNGDVLVAGYSTNAIVQVDKDDKRKIATVISATAGVSLPCCVWYTKKTTELIVGQDQNDNMVVFQLK